MIRGPAEGEAGAWRAKSVPERALIAEALIAEALIAEARIVGERTGASAGGCGVPPHPTGFDPLLAGQKGDALGPSRKDEGTD